MRARRELKLRRHGPRYRKIEVAMWGDERFQALSQPQPNAQTLWTYLLCGPRTTIFPGLVIARPEVMASDLRWSLEAFREALSEVCTQGLIDIDETVGVAVLRKGLFNGLGRTREDVRETARPESPNVILNWSKSWSEIPDCELKNQYLRELGGFAEALGEGFVKAYRVGFRKALAKGLVEAYADPSSNQDSGSGSGSGSGTGGGLRPSPSQASGDPDPDRVLAAERVLARLSEVTGKAYTSPEHVAMVASRIADGVDEYDLRAVVVYCADVKGWGKPDDKCHGNMNPRTLFGSHDNLARYLPDARSEYAQEIAAARRGGSS